MIIIHPFSKKLFNGGDNPKNYPFWEELIALIEKLGEPIVQIGIEGERQLVPDFRKNLSLRELSILLKECRIWISVDSFFQHLAWSENKKGIVLWGQGDPKIFGHEENINLLKDRKYLRKLQFRFYDETPCRKDCWVEPKEVIKYLI